MYFAHSAMLPMHPVGYPLAGWPMDQAEGSLDALNYGLTGVVKKSRCIPYPVARSHPLGNPDADPPCVVMGIGEVVV